MPSKDNTASGRPDVDVASFSPTRVVLENETNQLTKQSWCLSLITIEGVTFDAVSTRIKKVYENLPDESDLLALADRVQKSTVLRHHFRRLARTRYKSLLLLGTIGFVVILGVTVLVNSPYASSIAAAGVGLIYFALDKLLRRRATQGWLTYAFAERSRAVSDLHRWLRSVIEQAIREVTTLDLRPPLADIVMTTEGTGLSSRMVADQRIATASKAKIELHTLRRGGAAIGVTGERGMGKSEVLRYFARDAEARATVPFGGTVGVLLAIPSAYKGAQFLGLAPKPRS